MLTVDEYTRAPWRRRLAYRALRHPLVTFVLAGAYLFLVRVRIPDPRVDAHERASVHLTTLASAALLLVAWVGLGPATFATTVVTLRTSLRVLRWGLYDEHRHELVGFPALPLASLRSEDASHAGS